ncbi:NAD(P)/FAD-dependent oxidoreductase [Streptomyces mirabilis]|uniref:NAD(P)/FAD-dependent oxidoreductase n=1 Tax=Streptomyces mirabilis TaxID=68239 RepID=UPI00369F155D
MNQSHPSQHFHAVVIGGGLAGMLAAAAIKSTGASVDILEGDTLPDIPAPRKGLPQARHAHVLMSGGANAMEQLLPGLTSRLLAAGARRISLPTGMVGFAPEGWYRRWKEESQYVITCSRDLLDHTVRAAVLRREHITLHGGHRATGLNGSRTKVTAAQSVKDGVTHTWDADLIIDATGRGTRLPAWLTELGITGLDELRVDSGLAYASRVFRSPAGDADWPIVNIQADSRLGIPGRAGTLLPIEDGRWLASLSGTRGGQPTSDPDQFTAFARTLRHPLIAELLEHAEPLSDVSINRSTVNARRLYEKLTVWPDGLLAIGDAVATYNPVYGHGMSVAAQQALILRDELARQDIRTPGTTRSIQRTVARPANVAWTLATGQDIHYPDVQGGNPGLADRIVQAYASRLAYAACGRQDAAEALTEVMTLNADPTSLFLNTRTVWAAIRGPLLPPQNGPKFTAEEHRHLAAQTATDDTERPA